MTTPNTPANGGQILTPERIAEIADATGMMAKSDVLGDLDGGRICIDFARAIEADLRASLAAPAIPTVDRNAVLEEAATVCEARSNEHKYGPRWDSVKGGEAWACASAIRSLKSAAPVSVPQRVRTEQAGWIDKFGNVFPLGAYSPTGKPSYLDADKRGWSSLFREIADVAQPAAQVALTGETANPMFNIIPTMTKADEADAAKGICPACKYLGLKEISIAHGMRFMQCRKCKDIVVLATPATVKTAEQSDAQQEKP